MSRSLDCRVVQVGQRLHCILHGGKDGVVVRVHGKQSPGDCQTIGGVISTGGQADFDIVWDDGSESRRVPEVIVRGVQWRMYDKIVSADEVIDAVQLARLTEASTKEREELRAEQFAASKSFYVVLLRNTYPSAVPADKLVRGRPVSSQARAAANIRAELKAAFPGIKFSVTSRGFSMGDAVDISWELGPRTREVEAITGKYQYGHFNGMEDIYESSSSAFSSAVGAVLGQSKYVSESRDFPSDVLEFVGRALAEKQGVPYAEGWGPSRLYGEYDSDSFGQHARRVLCGSSFPAGAVITGVEHVPSDYRESGQEPYRAVFSVPGACESPVVSRDVSGWSVSSHYHAKREFTFWLVVPSSRLSADEFATCRARCESAGGWYSRKWGKIPGGFAFREESAALEFAGLTAVEPELIAASTAVRPVVESPVDLAEVESFAWL